MKVLLAQDTFLPLVGGAEVHVARLAAALRERGHSVEIVTATPGEPLVNGFRVWRFPRPSGSLAATLQWPLIYGQRCLKLTTGHDVVHGHYSYFLAAAFGLLCRIARRPFVLTLHGLNTLDSSVGRSKVKRLLRSVSLKSAGRVLATSEEMAEVAQRFVPRERIALVPNAVNYDEFAEIGDYLPPAPPFRVLTVRRLVPKNGVQYLVEAAPAVLKQMGPSVEFWIIGDGVLRDHLEQRVRELGLEPHFRFLGALANEEVKHYLRDAHVVVFPSSAESTSIAALEAMAARRPVVASRVGAFPELLGHGERGRLVTLFDRSASDYGAPLTLPADRLQDLADTISSALTERTEALRLAEAAQRFVRKNHDWRIIVSQIEATYTNSL